MLVEFLVDVIVNIMSVLGYWGLFFLMALESMIAPVPSEVVMPFAGFLVVEGRFTLFFVALVSGLGSVFGSLLSYWIGEYGGRKFVLKFGKYLLLDESHLEWTEKFFRKYGEKTIFVSRFIPVVRHLISIPAGIGRMNMKKFIVYTFAGATAWNVFLAYLGVKLKENWEIVHEYSSEIDIVVLILFALFVAYFVYRHVVKNIRKKKIKEILEENASETFL